ncbi:M28 family metallopeptidase [Candidatus Latescibacterota bacterium]
MKRRHFINSIGQSSVLAAVASACSKQQSSIPTSVSVDTVEAREAYLARLLKLLCTDLGPRPAGSDAYEKAALIVKKEMELSLPTVSLDTLTINTWEMTGEPELIIENEPVYSFPTIGSLGTPPEGINGILKKIDDKNIPYGIFNRESGELVGYIYVWDGAARGRSCTPFGKEAGCPPFFIIGKADEELIERSIENQTLVHLKNDVTFNDRPSSNVIGTIPGESSDEVVFMAHLDSVYSSPGANDNAASLIVILMLAHAVAGTRPKNTLTFIASTAEEIGQFGARHFVEKRKSEGTLNNIKYSFNFDSVTWGPNIHIQTEDEETRTLFLEIDKEKQIRGRVQAINRSGATNDNTPFRNSQTKCIYVGSSGYDTNQFCWHRPNDIPTNVPVDCAEITYQLFREYIARVHGV